jgi:uncharacterized protein YbaR (Trm112 family)/2-polyprenyl-3-methyl-5-hydroxy-6-metoxy-1,4-benzoquinol methylase
MRQSLAPLLACPSCAGSLQCSSVDDNVSFGVLTCGCGRWFPIEREIPELLPDHLRDWHKDLARIDVLAAALPDDRRNMLRAYQPSQSPNDDGSPYKKAEIGIKDTVDEPLFFVPGSTSPFAPWNPSFTLYLIKLFGVSAPLLNLQQGDIVVDSGCGYAWTTEWLLRAGFDPIGVDICRTYLDIAIERTGTARYPHLLVGDIEHLPLRADIAKGVLAFESFHHIPDRRRAMTQYERVLNDGGVVVLAEPGAEHEHAPAAVAAMTKYGILERGMELADVTEYAKGTTFAVEQVLLMRLAASEVPVPVNAAFASAHTAIEGNLFRAVKGGARAVASPVEPSVLRRGLFERFKQRFQGQ